MSFISRLANWAVPAEAVSAPTTKKFCQDARIHPSLRRLLTYGGMSVREMEAITVGLDETMDEDFINQGPTFIAFMVDELVRNSVPVVTPAGGLGCHINAMEFVDHIPQMT